MAIAIWSGCAHGRWLGLRKRVSTALPPWRHNRITYRLPRTCAAIVSSTLLAWFIQCRAVPSRDSRRHQLFCGFPRKDNFRCSITLPAPRRQNPSLGQGPVPPGCPIDANGADDNRRGTQELGSLPTLPNIRPAAMCKLAGAGRNDDQKRYNQSRCHSQSPPYQPEPFGAPDCSAQTGLPSGQPAHDEDKLTLPASGKEQRRERQEQGFH